MADLKKPLTPRKPPGRFLRLVGKLASPLPESLRRLVRATLVLLYAVFCYGVAWLQSRRFRPPRFRRYQRPAFPTRHIRFGGVKYPIEIDLAFGPKMKELDWIEARYKEAASSEERLALARRAVGIFAPGMPRQQIARLREDQLAWAITCIKAWLRADLKTWDAALERFR